MFINRWWANEFQVERSCDHKKRSQCSCINGWGVVDSHDTREAAIQDAQNLTKQVGIPYRVTLRSTGEVVT